MSTVLEKPEVWMEARIGEGEESFVIFVKGREAWALAELDRAGEAGCTPLENPAPRWSSYIERLRERGVIIETIFEPHHGRFAGRHGRYVLRSKVEILDKEGL
jgi:hypothetical protein